MSKVPKNHKPAILRGVSENKELADAVRLIQKQAPVLLKKWVFLPMTSKEVYSAMITNKSPFDVDLLSNLGEKLLSLPKKTNKKRNK